MGKLLLLLCFSGFLSCQPKDTTPNDVAARAAGKYVIQSYVLNGDTLYTSKGINKLGVSEFYIIVDRKGPDSVRIGSVYKTIGEAGSQIHIKDVGVSETNGSFQLTAATSAPQLYECRIEGNAFYERSVRGGPGIFVVPPGYTLKTPADPALEGVIIAARK
ncbi:hypothetical protein EXU85_21325 [Spirosoma sp. KCTC 42546]|uniref:hypothetical protein n=1 Tax=Spirosoma sp. KCTC 42546 TaxID=2520506 RepID=UPI001158EA0D|nr:hypothetical protein [Spirosoma sp. KCTC 42546]QDK81016.1 hypothetical protein EXU85_21325 [Spirosoma sp. KCTC 42546]